MGGPAGRAGTAVTEARLTGFSGPKVGGTQRPAVSLVGKVLKAAAVGDLMSLTLTPGDGEGHMASGEEKVHDVWFAVTKISTSSGGRHLVEGEMFGLKVQVVDQPQGGARLGITGVVVNPTASWLARFPGWETHLIKQAQIEPLLMSSVVGARIVSSLSTLEKCVSEHPGAWTGGEVSARRRAVITDPIERATQCAGELLALLEGERSVAMCQLWAGWADPGEQPAGAPWAGFKHSHQTQFRNNNTRHIYLFLNFLRKAATHDLSICSCFGNANGVGEGERVYPSRRVAQILQRAAESEDVGVEMSVSDDVEGHPGLTAVLYNKKAVKATKPEHRDNAGELNALAATTIAKLGAQAAGEHCLSRSLHRSFTFTPTILHFHSIDPSLLPFVSGASLGVRLSPSFADVVS